MSSGNMDESANGVSAPTRKFGSAPWSSNARNSWILGRLGDAPSTLRLPH